MQILGLSRWHCTGIAPQGHFQLGAHEMATIKKLMSGNFRVQIRRRGQYASKTFLRRADAQSWALAAERRADRGEPIEAPTNKETRYFRDLIDLHIADMKK